MFLLLSSCDKGEKEEPKFCWDCILTYYTRNQFAPDWKISSTTKQEYCDMTEEEITRIIREFETKGGNYTAYKLECTKRQ